MATIDGAKEPALVSSLTIIFQMRALFERILSPTSLNSVKTLRPETRGIHKAKPAVCNALEPQRCNVRHRCDR